MNLPHVPQITCSPLHRPQTSISPVRPQVLSCFKWQEKSSLVSYFYFQMASVPVKTSIGCMEFGRQCPSDQVWCGIVNIVMSKPSKLSFIPNNALYSCVSSHPQYIGRGLLAQRKA